MDALRDVRRTMDRYVRRLTRRERLPGELGIEDLLYRAGRTLSLDELLVEVPRQVCAMLRLSSFHLLIREGARYAVPAMSAGAFPLDEVSFAASSPLVAHLKRETAPVLVQKTPPDAWTMLSTPEELAALGTMDAQWLLPLHGRTGLVGFATMSRDVARPFTAPEMRTLRSLGAQLGPGLETARFQRSLEVESARRARADRELELAREVQERLLPGVMPKAEGLETAAMYRSAEQVGGDYYDAFETPDGRFCFVIADVSGKGTPAALLMATLRASLRSLMTRERSLPVLLAEMNRQLYAASSASRYATFAMVVYEPETRVLVSANAGHCAPVLLRSDGSLARLECGGPVLGLLPAAEYEQEQVRLQAGDLLAMFTDGFSEAENARGDEWGDEGLIAALHRCGMLPAASCVAGVLAEVERFTTGAPQRDDMTLLMLRKL